MQRENLTLGGLLTRYAVAAILVYGTWTPERFSYWHWAISPLLGDPATPGPAPLKFLVGILLLTAWGIFLNATRRSLGLPGALLTLAILGGIIWLLIDLNWVSARSGRGIAHVALIAVSILLCAGMSWSFISRRLSGQVDIDVTE